MSLLSDVKVIMVVMVMMVLTKIMLLMKVIENEKIDQMNKATGDFVLMVAREEPDDKG